MIGLVIVCLLLGFVGFQFAWLRYNGSTVAVPDIPREPQTIGSGNAIRYAVMGDSSAVGQGGEYSSGIAAKSAQHLAKNSQVTWINTAVSGARVADVLNKQLPEVERFKPDVVVILASSNDVTHLTSIKSVMQSLQETIQRLKDINCDVKIIVSGSADMGAPPRLPQPLRYFAGIRAKQINTEVIQLADQQQITFAPIAQKTGPQFRSDRSLFAPDNFHPNTKGYKLWTLVITEALDGAVKSQPSHCQ